MRFLIVDDDSNNRMLLDGMLGDTADCVQAASGPEAVAVFKAAWQEWRPFNLILLDIMMPDMDGVETIEQIRGLERERQVAARHRAKILMVTALANESKVRECVEKGCDDYIAKPITLKHLYRKLKRLNLLD